MNYLIVQYLPDLGFISDMVPEENLAAWCEVRGFNIIGTNANPKHRTELQGCPIISGLCGPMWDGDKVRYESDKANDILST